MSSHQIVLVYNCMHKIIQSSYLSLKHFEVNLSLYRHLEVNSSHLFSETFGSALVIMSFHICINRIFVIYKHIYVIS